MSRNYEACWTCRIRRKGGCQGPGPSGDCSRCIDLNVECLRGYGQRIPKDYRRPEIVEELSRWNRRKSSRRAPEKLPLGALLQRIILEEEATTADSADESQSVRVTFSPPTATFSYAQPLSHQPQSSQSSQADVTAESVYLSSISASGLSNSSPTISCTSSPLQSTFSSMTSGSAQGSPVYLTASPQTTRETLVAHALQRQLPPPPPPQANLLSEIASDYSSYVGLFTPSPELSTVPRSQLEADLAASRFVDMRASRSSHGIDAAGSLQSLRSSTGIVPSVHATSNVHNQISPSSTTPSFDMTPQPRSSPMFLSRTSQNQPTLNSSTPPYPLHTPWTADNIFAPETRQVNRSEQTVPSHQMRVDAGVPSSSSWHTNLSPFWSPPSTMHHAMRGSTSIAYSGVQPEPLPIHERGYTPTAPRFDHPASQRGYNAQVNLEMAAAQYQLLHQSRGHYMPLAGPTATTADSTSRPQQGNILQHFPVQTHGDVNGLSRPNEAPIPWAHSNQHPPGS